MLMEISADFFIREVASSLPVPNGSFNQFAGMSTNSEVIFYGKIKQKH